MSRMQRISNVIAGIGMLLGALIIFVLDDGSRLIAAVLALSLILRGMRELIYYFSMARHMVGGKSILLIGVFLFDFGVFTLTLVDEKRLIVMLYLAAWHAFSGLVAMLRAFEARRYKAASWKLNALRGLGGILTAAACFIFRHDSSVLLVIYSVGLLYAGIMRIASAFRRTAVVYIQ